MAAAAVQINRGMGVHPGLPIDAFSSPGFQLSSQIVAALLYTGENAAPASSSTGGDALMEDAAALQEASQLPAASSSSSGSSAMVDAPASQAPRLPQEGDTLTNGDLVYKLGGLIGKGSTSHVFKTEDPITGEPLAAKCFLDDVEQSYIEKEAQHLQRTKRVCHAVKIHSWFGKTILCEFLGGRSLHSMYKGRKSSRLPYENMVSIIRQSLEYQRDLLKLGLLHADHKPSNYAYNRLSNTLTVMDLGIAQEYSPFSPLVLLVQTRMYRAPEVILKLPYGPSLDVFSLACVIYKLYTGEILFPTDLSLEDDSFAFNNAYLHMLFFHLGPPSLEFLRENPSTFSLYFEEQNGRPKLKTPPCPLYRLPEFKWKDVISAAAFKNHESQENSLALLDLMEKMLRFEDRISVEDALSHPCLRADLKFHVKILDGLVVGTAWKLSLLAVSEEKKVIYSRTFKKGCIPPCFHIPRSLVEEGCFLNLELEHTVQTGDKCFRTYYHEKELQPKKTEEGRYCIIDQAPLRLQDQCIIRVVASVNKQSASIIGGLVPRPSVEAWQHMQRSKNTAFCED